MAELLPGQISHDKYLISLQGNQIIKGKSHYFYSPASDYLI